MSVQGLFSSIGLVVVVLLSADGATAQQYYQQPCTSVDCYRGQCAQTRCCPERQAQIQAVPPAGAFAAGPQSGEVVGESTGFGIRGMSFTLPAITFELPSIRLPSVFKTRRDAHMRVDASTAPFVQGQPAVFGQIPGTFQAQNFAQTQAEEPCAEEAGSYCEPERCTDFDGAAGSSSDNSTYTPPAPAADDDLSSLTPRERLLLLQILKERQRVAQLESQMQKLSAAVEGELYSLQDENSLFESTQPPPQPVARQKPLEHPWASNATEIRQTQFVNSPSRQR